MGTSTRKRSPRTNKIINENIGKGGINAGGHGQGLAELIPQLLFPQKGQSKIKKTANEVFSSQTYYNSVTKITKLVKTINSSGLGGIPISGFSKYKHSEQIELICDYLGIEEDDYLKQSFRDTLSNNNIFNGTINPALFIIEYIQNILKNILEAFSFEDASDNIKNFDDAKTDDDYFNFIKNNSQEQLKICLDDSFIENIDNEAETKEILDNAFSKLLNGLRM